ncbi:TetR family transcriptional regulator C-terminal domain-containing protein [Puniceibacterium sediminis]|uniref:Transcriptional regulator, TetR family n=1 Tax=Puniceibacterium sediminis TaxID=1608407 RepID=A0A238VKV0_9RHOB|nr:TetR family transcriptional regulator C-terminal domain-containing protein [Puniceibacterium sediminis]SNR34737.1 transcriptional regulator, TetR family [Puniceibacterium sediminis]
MPQTATAQPEKKPSRIQLRNRRKILDAALDVFSQHGFRGATLDQIAEAAGLSKPNMLYYFDSKEAIHVALLNALMDEWLAPLAVMDPDGIPLDELLAYIDRKMEMSRAFPRESRLFANEIIQGAPRILQDLEHRLKPLFDEKCRLIRTWMEEGKLAPMDPGHLIFSIWAMTQHYADFEAQVQVLMPDTHAAQESARTHVAKMFRNLLSV